MQVVNVSENFLWIKDDDLIYIMSVNQLNLVSELRDLIDPKDVSSDFDIIEGKLLKLSSEEFDELYNDWWFQFTADRKIERSKVNGIS